jgi:ornithine cyclodeaminase/alanine dehydrogenase-like protein (mu-crystallin family)
MLVLTRADIAGVLDIADVITAVEQAHAAVARGTATEGTRAVLPLRGSSALLIPMTATIGPLGASGLKLLTDTPDNPASSRPRQQSLIMLLDQQANAVEAILDGAEITSMRTAAASAVATRHLARADCATLGLIGAGALASMHLRAIRAVRPIQRVIAWSRSSATLSRFTASVADDTLEVVAAGSAQEVAARADVVCTLTPARTPVLRGAWLRPGTHVNAVGAPPRPEYREIDAEVIRRSRVIVDSLAVARSESGAIRAAIVPDGSGPQQIAGELGQVIAGHIPGRLDPGQITLYNSVGLAIQDIATARLLVGIARRKGLGTEVAITS